MRGCRLLGSRGAWFVWVGALVLSSLSLFAQRVKAPVDELDNLAFSRDEIWLTAQNESFEALKGDLPRPTRDAVERFRALQGPGATWKVSIDRVTGRLSLLEGSGIPWIPGTANALTGWDLGLKSATTPGAQVPIEAVAERARAFVLENPDLFAANPDDLALNRVASGPMLDYLYFVEFDWIYRGIPVDGARLSFRLNHGNLIQIGQDYMSDAILSLDTTPAITAETAWQITEGYAGWRGDEEVLQEGRLLVLPTTTRGVALGERVRPGSGMRYRLVYELLFRRPGVMGTWQARVDAHTGELVSFFDANKYGHIQGGVHLTDGYPADTSMPFPYANYSGTTNFADVAGNFAGTTGTSTMVGDLVRIADSCGAISEAADGTGLINFGSNTGTDCNTPGHGGAGNTRAARTQYWHVTAIKVKALTYMPTNNWLSGQLLDSVNLTTAGYCPGNAWWNGSSLNFCVGGGGYGNTGELPGVSLHEWGHGMDSNDGRAPADEGTGETYGDFSAALQTHQSCIGQGFASQNCDGYGDGCRTCKGVRDIDWAAHSDNNPHTPFMLDDTDPNSYTCRWWAWPQTYNGPCRYEGHCESYISSESCWDLAVRDLPAMGIDATTSWQIMDRLWYASRPTAQSAYTCSATSGVVNSSDGSNAGSLYNIFRVVDDCDGNLANGTPHAAAIFAALARHNIAVGAAGDATNQNQTNCCPTLATPSITVVAASCQNTVSWGAITNAQRYDIFRNETSCTAGFTKVGSVNAPGLSFADTAVSAGTTYYYRVQAVGSSDACTSAMSNCVSRVAAACGGACTAPGAPNLTAATPSCTGVALTWSAGTGTTLSYNVFRKTSPCGGTYTQIAGPVTGTTYTDTAAAAGTTYAYVVTGACDAAGAYDSGYSNCLTAAALGTPAMPAAPTLTDDCTGIIVAWTAISGATSYNVMRRTGGCGNNGWGAVQSGITGTAWTDTTAATGTTYGYYIVAVNACGSAGDKAYCAALAHAAAGAPVAPTGLTATGACAAVNLSWNASVGATSYNILRTTNSNCSTGLAQIGTSATASHSDTSAAVGTTYYYVVQAVSACGTSGNSSCANAARLQTPAAPTGLGATGTCTAVDLSWTASAGATSYEVWRTTNANCTTGVALLGTSATTTYSDTSAVAGTTYYYTVKAVNACGTSAVSTCGNAARLAAPTAPTGVAATGTCTGNTVTWTASAGATSYNVIRGTTCGTVATTFTGVSSPYNDTTAVAGTAYQYWVVAVNTCGNSANSTCAAATRLATPVAPAAPTYASVSCSTLTVNWTAVSGAATYDLYRRTGVCGAGTLLAADLAGTTYADTGLAASTQYSYYTVAKNACGSSANGTCSSVTTTAGPSAPAAPTVTDGCTGLAISWPVATGAATYTVYRRDGGCGNNTWTAVQSGLAGTSWTDATAALSSTYGYYIEAVNTCGTATSGNAACTAGTHSLATPATPASILATGSCTGVTVTWAASTGATSYTLYRGTACGTILATFAGATSPYGDTTAVAGTAYQYWVSASNACGTSGSSTCASGTRLVSPTPTITGAASNTCPSVTVALSTEAGQSAYQWYRGGTPIGGATSFTYGADTTGTYTVSYTAANGCAGTSIGHAVTISPCVPNIVYQSHTGPTAVNEDGDGVMEAGEKWSLTVTVTNNGQAPATAVLGSLAGEGITVCANPGSFGDVAAGGTGSATFEFVVDSTAWYTTYACGSSIGFDLGSKSSNGGGYTYPNDTNFVSQQVGQPGGTTTENGVGPNIANAKNGTKTSLIAPAFTLIGPVDSASVSFTLSGHPDPTTCVQVDLVAPGGASTTLKGLGIAAAPTYDVKAFYDAQGVGSYTLRVTEQSGCGGASDAADVTGIAMSVSNTAVGQCDTWVASCSCAAPTSVAVPIAADLNGPCADDGIQITWSADPGNWGDGGAGTRTYDLLRDGSPLITGLAYGTTGYTDTTGLDGTSYTFAVVYTNGCSTAAQSAGASASDIVDFPSPSISGGAANICPSLGVDLSTEAGMSAYQWYLDGNPIAGATAAIHTATTSGGYTVSYQSASGCLGNSGLHAVTISACPVPGEVAPGDGGASTAQNWTDKITLTWPSLAGADNYTLYRGVLADLANGDILNGNADSCMRPNSGIVASNLTEDPSAEAGRFYWYIVTASNASGEGPAGSSTLGPRVPNSIGACP